MSRINKGKTLTLMSAVAVVAIISSLILTAFGVDNTSTTATTTYATNNEQENNIDSLPLETNGWLCAWGRRGFVRGHCRFIEVSEEFEENVMSIANNDQDVLDLLDDGYTVMGVRPVIKNRVEANGDIVTKATSAILMLEKDTTGHASVWVDLEAGKVTRIVILTRTVIEKP